MPNFWGCFLFMEEKDNKLERLVRGAVGIAKNITGVGLTTDEVKKQRLDICKSCEYLIKKNKILICGKCGCFVMLKAKVVKENCPLNKW